MAEDLEASVEEDRKLKPRLNLSHWAEALAVEVDHKHKPKLSHSRLAVEALAAAHLNRKLKPNRSH